MKQTTERDLVLPLASSGVLMAAYLLARPYGDSPWLASTAGERAAAFASVWWVLAHVAGALALVSFARAALRLSDLARDDLAARLARWSGLAGAVLVLPYFGAETFGLHAIGKRVLAGDADVLTLVEDVRGNGVALAMFGLGLLLLAISGISFAVAWTRWSGSRAAWPLGIAVALVLPQFYLPPVGRMAFGLAYLLAAAVLVGSILRRNEPIADPSQAAPASRAG